MPRVNHTYVQYMKLSFLVESFYGGNEWDTGFLGVLLSLLRALESFNFLNRIIKGREA